MRERIAREADRERRSISGISSRPGQNPSVVLLMILVMVILGGLLIGKANMSTKVSKLPTREMRAEGELRALRIAVERFREDCGRYPSKTEGLRALVLDPGMTNWGGHYVNIVKPDPWRTPYHYALTNNTVILFSHGEDGREGTDDDLPAPTPSPEEIKRQ
ncbi:MAG: hypothetical protein HN341_14085 [Verrucomicrobia bacterium]|nr:hypothetical protein [Verrucomicrobiota bacterium]